jgi:hypothetical protein
LAPGEIAVLMQIGRQATWGKTTICNPPQFHVGLFQQQWQDCRIFSVTAMYPLPLGAKITDNLQQEFMFYARWCGTRRETLSYFSESAGAIWSTPMLMDSTRLKRLL